MLGKTIQANDQNQMLFTCWEADLSFNNGGSFHGVWGFVSWNEGAREPTAITAAGWGAPAF